jgi:hypothetical protein
MPPRRTLIGLTAASSNSTIRTCSHTSVTATIPDSSVSVDPAFRSVPAPCGAPAVGAAAPVISCPPDRCPLTTTMITSASIIIAGQQDTYRHLSPRVAVPTRGIGSGQTKKVAPK